jgi:two-component system NtrC family response regulator
MRLPDYGAGPPASGALSGAALGCCVLVVGGDRHLVDRIERRLGGRSPVVEHGPTLETAEELRKRVHFDLIVADTVRPPDAVMQWVERLRGGGDLTPVVLLADALDPDLLLAALRAGASDCVARMPGQGELAAALARVLDTRSAGADEGSPGMRSAGDVFDADGIVGESRAMQSLCDVVRRVAPTPVTVLVEGESGTGKELVARAIHRLSERKGNFAAVNCGAITAELFESELFGHTKGAFTGALQARSGLFAHAEGGTVLLDEIGEMPLPMQAKLLRVLEQRTIRPVGSNREVPVDIRVIAATNHDLALRVEQGAFREDLYHRLNVVSLRVPALRERVDDIRVLGSFFVDGFSTRMGVRAPKIGEAEWLRLRQYSWPGNVRELRNTIERCVLLNRAPSACLEGTVTAGGETDDDTDDLTLETVERRHILAVLALSAGNKSETARRLSISRKTLERKLRRWAEESR